MAMHEPFMARAIELAVANVHAGGGPFAALVVNHGAVIAEGANRVTANLDPTAHAEVVAIRAACAALGSFHLEGCDIYCTCEPCPMCLGAIYWARPARIFCAAEARDAAAAGFDDSFIYEQLRLPWDARRIPIVPLMREEARRPFEEWAAKPDKTPY
jgi:guanine deaminase